MKHTPCFTKGILLATLPGLFLSSCLVGSGDRGVGRSLSVEEVHQAVPVVVAPAAIPPPETNKRKIKIALLLDTSNSMDGLIDQARAQLWKLVNELSLAKYGDEKPQLEIALYEYGNDQLLERDGFVRQVTAFTTDLDLISEKLFALKTKGGNEYCGQVISDATRQLTWGTDSLNLQVIFIAGNESFYQGPVNSAKSCLDAKKEDIIVNTIYCGNYKQGLSEGWNDGAIVANGNYMCIEQNNKTQYIETPFDSEIAALNDALNATYVTYGSTGNEKKLNQMSQDANAADYGGTNVASRVITKSRSVYKNDSWDMVDAVKFKRVDVTKVKEEDLPGEMKGKSAEQKKQFIEQKTAERAAVVKKIELLNMKRNEFIKQKALDTKKDNTSLDAAMIKAIRAQAAKKKFVFES